MLCITRNESIKEVAKIIIWVNTINGLLKRSKTAGGAVGKWGRFCLVMLGCLFMFVSGIECLSSYSSGIFTHKVNSNNSLGIDREIVMMDLYGYNLFFIGCFRSS